MTKNAEVVAKIDRLLQLRADQVRLLRELREMYVLADRFGVDADNVASTSYEPHRDRRWDKWPPYYKQFIEPIPNVLTTRDGRRVELDIDWRAELELVKARLKK